MKQSDEYYERIDKHDIDILRKAKAYLLVAPVLSVGFVYLLNKFRHEMLMSQHFFYVIKRY
jgi:hypothetical protein